MRKGHDNSNFSKARKNTDHKKGATHNNTVGGGRMNMGFGNAPNGK